PLVYLQGPQEPLLTGDRWFESGSLQRRVRLSRGRDLCRSRTPRFARVCAADVAARSAATCRIFRYRANRRQYLCRAIFQYAAPRLLVLWSFAVEQNALAFDAPS